MRARTGIAGTAHRVRLTAVVWGLTTILAFVALSACTSSGTSTGTGSTPPSSPLTVLSPHATTPSGGTSSSASSESASSQSASSQSASSSTSAPASQSPSPTESQSPSPSPSPIPSEAPVTGGGGTAGFQDAWLAVLGGAAIVAGLASIAYRYRMTRRR
jgi:hypothetical protein